MNKKVIVILFPVFVVLFASLFSSKHPDTLETFAVNQGFEKQAKKIVLIFNNYNLHFINNQFLSSFCAGIIGLVLLYILYETIKFFTK
ncbi:MAG: hypothetical protein Nk1A_3660 [Endomicrobiia bacterium]|nr:MAG: hypothetical protein Nk1A_3660 [Endomicrobiia bacterium]